MREIKLTQGKVALVDDWEYERLSKYTWHAIKSGRNLYAGRNIPYNNQRAQKQIRMHNVVFPPPINLEVDHIDGNGLNNQKHNLRHCSRTENQMNQRPTVESSSKYKGVCWDRDKFKWRARIRLDKKIFHLGYFKSEKDAGLVYNCAAIEHFGEFARLNDISNTSLSKDELLEKLIELEKGERI